MLKQENRTVERTDGDGEGQLSVAEERHREPQRGERESERATEYNVLVNCSLLSTDWQREKSRVLLLRD
jgi:hypothetical protein